VALVVPAARDGGLRGRSRANRRPRVTSLDYAVITPVRDEAENLGRLRDALAAQTHPPAAWIVVDTGSGDGTPELLGRFAEENPWIRSERLPVTEGAARGAPIVRAFHHGLRLVPASCDAVVKLDADISFPPDHFERLLGELQRDERLGIAGGIGHELDANGHWRQRHGTGAGVWGAARAYRRTCLDQLLPLEERMGWDTLDLLKAEVLGWRVRVFEELPFRHHRAEAERDPSSYFRWRRQGEAARYMGYRWSYTLLRTLFRMARDPAAVGILHGYLSSALGREELCRDPEVRSHVRDRQRLRQLPLRAREVVRPRKELRDASVES
jgi:biofilm PGA synthesis N-glycosyltransferase PgaC